MMHTPKGPLRELRSTEQTEPERWKPSALQELFRRHGGMIAGLGMIFGTLGAAYLSVTPAYYTGSASLLAEPVKLRDVQEKVVLEDSVNPSFVDSQIAILASDAVIRLAVSKLEAEGVKDLSEPAGVPAVVLRHIFSFLGFTTRDPDSTDVRVIQIRNGMSAHRVSRSDVIEISYQSSDRIRAAQVANALAEAYLDDQVRTKTEAMQRASSWLKTRIVEIRGQSLAADRAVQSFRISSNVINGTADGLDDQQLAELNNQLARLREDRDKVSSQIVRFEGIIESSRITTNKTSVISNEIATELRKVLADSGSRANGGTERQSDSNEGNDYLNDRKDVFASWTWEEVDRIHKNLYERLKRIKEEEASQSKNLIEQLRRANAIRYDQDRLRDLESASQAFRTIYENLLKEHYRISQQYAFPIAEARLVSRAWVPTSRSHPKVVPVLVVSTLIGLGLGFTGALARELTNSSIRTQQQMREVTGSSSLGTVPAARSRDKATCLAGNTHEGDRGISTDAGLSSLIISQPNSLFSECIRRVDINIDYFETSSRRIIGITSCCVGEGKSIVASNLALQRARRGYRTLLIDCNRESPLLSSRLARGAKAGLPDVIGGQVPYTEAVVSDAGSGLDFLPGQQIHPADFYNLLGSPAMEVFLSRVRHDYERVFLDLPSLSHSVDTAQVAPFVDSYILVIKWGTTTTAQVEHALILNPQVEEKLIGCVLNSVPPSDIKRS